MAGGADESGNYDWALARIQGGYNRAWAQHDANYNITALADNTGKVVQRFVYSAYGVQTVLTGAWAAGGASSSVYGFQGGRFDITTRLNRFGVRDYSADVLVWIERDPAEYVAGCNEYASFSGDPSSKVDASGKAAAPPAEPENKTPNIAQVPVKLEIAGSVVAGVVAEVGGHVGATIGEICLSPARVIDTIAEGKNGALSYNSNAKNKVPLLWIPLQQGLNRWWGHWWNECKETVGAYKQ